MNILKLNFTSALLSFITLYFFSLTPNLNAQVDPSAYANGIKAMVVISPKGEIKAIKMAPPKFKTQSNQIAVKLSVQGNRLKMELLGKVNSKLSQFYIEQPIGLSPSLAKALKISNPNKAKLRKGIITIHDGKYIVDIPTLTPLKAIKK